MFLPYFDCYLYFYYLFLLFAFFLIFSRLLELYFLSRPGNSIIVINETTTLKKTKEQSPLQVVLSKWEDNLLNDIFWVSRKKFQGPLNHYFRAFPPLRVFVSLFFCTCRARVVQTPLKRCCVISSKAPATPKLNSRKWTLNLRLTRTSLR